MTIILLIKIYQSWKRHWHSDKIDLHLFHHVSYTILSLSHTRLNVFLLECFDGFVSIKVSGLHSFDFCILLINFLFGNEKTKISIMMRKWIWVAFLRKGSQGTATLSPFCSRHHHQSINSVVAKQSHYSYNPINFNLCIRVKVSLPPPSCSFI